MSCRNLNCHCGNGKIPGYDDPCNPKNCAECGTAKPKQQSRTNPPAYPCTHPELRPTRWGEAKPAPAKYVGCSHSYICPTCGYGQGMWPDPCDPPDDKTDEEEFWNMAKIRDMIHKLGLTERDRNYR